MTRLAVVSASDANYFDLLQGMVCSLRDKPQGRDAALYVFDIGLVEAQRRWLLSQGATLHVPQDPLHRAGGPMLHAFLSRSRIPDLFPGHDVYLWIDADAWIQRWEAVEAYVAGALRAGFAVTPETDTAYTMEISTEDALRAGFVIDPEPNPAYISENIPTASWRALALRLTAPSFAMFGLQYIEQLCAIGPVNAGVFAGRADAPHWRAWRQMIEENIHKADSFRLLFLLDQTALCIVSWQDRFKPALLPTTCNWLCDHAHPMISGEGATLVRPLPPHEPLGIVHQTDYTKRIPLPLRCLRGGVLSRTLGYLYGSSS